MAQPPQEPEPLSASQEEVPDPFAQQDAEDANPSYADGEEDLSEEVFDISDVEMVARGTQELIPGGTYPARVDRCTYKTSNAGNRMFAIQWLLKQPDSEEYLYRVFDHPTLSPKQLGQTKHMINMLLNGEVDWSHFKGVEIAARLVGCEAMLRVRQSKGQGGYDDSMAVVRVLPAAEAMGGFAN